ncbi:Nucleoside-diphosphate-sugar epimerase [Fulvimarina manganoxydans]|uniref:Nucleoside-diphosphate-sugar epimerase n=1 Tax=Fulvimarina manganoxydans TaxID=937218 RepID=A0A1W2E7E5_9HYPH|nr:D-erythronate dehydrogenase [Fulvimarina manganoxydans]SMD05641.1 Nucleoside-diphosphate-sugar epimerase [Fulvimarina manganoxydans]
MRILVLGAAGMVGRRLIDRLLAEGTIAGQAIDVIDAVDVIAAEIPATGRITIDVKASDVSDPDEITALIDKRPDIIFHLAAIVSGEAEADFEKGYRINQAGMSHLLEAIRAKGGNYRPRLVFTSSIAVFGAPFEEPIGDTFLMAPLTSYGTQKAICELLLNDYSRKGFVDGVGIRLPTIVVRPGKPNKAASSFFSGIIREPLAGQEAILPVADDVRHWVASPSAAIGFLMHAATMDTERLGARRCLTMPGLSVTIAEMIEALRMVAGDEVAGRIRREPDAVIEKIVAGWPRDFAADRALQAGFTADPDFASIIKAHIADEKQRVAQAGA